MELQLAGMVGQPAWREHQIAEQSDQRRRETKRSANNNSPPSVDGRLGQEDGSEYR